MENFWYQNDLVNDFEDLLIRLDLEDEDVKNLSKDWSIDCEKMDKERIFNLKAENIMDYLDEERFSMENGDSEYEVIYKIINENIDFNKINNLMPSLYYPNGTSFKVTKKDLLEYIEK